MRTTPFFDALDPGIRYTVRWLRDHNFDTTDSGDGVTKLAAGLTVDDGVLDVPHVFMQVEPRAMIDESARLRMLLRTHGLGGGGRIEASYNPDDGVAILALYEIDDAALMAAVPTGSKGE